MRYLLWLCQSINNVNIQHTALASVTLYACPTMSPLSSSPSMLMSPCCIEQITTSYCSTDSERLHCCCHLLSNFGLRWIFPIHHNGPGDAASKNCLFLWETGAPPYERFIWPTRVHAPNGTSIGSAVFVRLAVVINRYIHRPRNTGNNRPHLIL